MKLTQHFRQFPGACRVGIIIAWLVAIFVVIIPTWQALPAVVQSLKEADFSLPHSTITDGDKQMDDLCKELLRSAKANPKYCLRDYFTDLYAIHRKEDVLDASHARRNTFCSNMTIQTLQEHAGFGHDLNILPDHDDMLAASKEAEDAYYKWHLKQFHSEPDGMNLTHHHGGDDWSWDWLWQVGFVVGWRYLACCLLFAFMYLLKWGSEGSEADEQRLAQGGLQTPFWQACFLWPLHFWRYPFDKLREFRIAVAEQRHREEVWQPITVKDRARYRRIASSKEAFAAWREKQKTRPAPRWGLALATGACLFLLFAGSNKASAATTLRSVSHHSVVARGRGDPYIRSPLDSYQVADSVCPTVTRTEPPSEALQLRDNVIWARLAACLCDGWSRCVDHVPLSYSVRFV